MSPPASPSLPATGGAPSLRVTGARLVWTGGREVEGGEVICRDGVVAAAEGPARTEEVLDASGCVVTPGLVNAHHHLLQCAFRTLPAARHVAMRDWLATMAGAYAAAGVDDELVGAAASVGLAEALLCGVTTLADHHLTWPPGADDVSFARAAVGAAGALGARLVVVRGSAGGDPERAATSAEAIAAALGVGWDGLSGDGMVQLAVGPAGVHSDGPETFALLGEVAGRLGLRRRTQANEQVDVEVAAARYGRRPLELLAEWGWLAPDVTVAHLCQITAEEVSLLATSGASATHAPGCDLPSGWGLAPVGALLDHGVAVGLGTSGGGSNDAGHLLADARLAMQVAPLARPAGATVTARIALSMATAGSARGLGRGELGTLEPGAAADLCCWDVSGAADAGVADPLAGLLWASPGRRPRHVVVAGRVVVRDGRLAGADEAELARRLDAMLAQRAARPPSSAAPARDAAAGASSATQGR
ncbi:MAG TPA: amidohydrolase family protein [Acidimicrobiales bacterium]|nr:amidohydrolase family protein [Acidimicrobiales bacterium]